MRENHSGVRPAPGAARAHCPPELGHPSPPRPASPSRDSGSQERRPFLGAQLLAAKCRAACGWRTDGSCRTGNTKRRRLSPAIFRTSPGGTGSIGATWPQAFPHGHHPPSPFPAPDGLPWRPHAFHCFFLLTTPWQLLRCPAGSWRTIWGTVSFSGQRPIASSLGGLASPSRLGVFGFTEGTSLSELKPGVSIRCFLEL